jgi:Ca2+-binding EF-hand superfamily protein
MQQEKSMTTSTKLAFTFLALAGFAGGVAHAAESKPSGDNQQRAMMRFARLDTDQSGNLTFEEFSVAMKTRLGRIDANSDGKITKSEISAAGKKMQSQQGQQGQMADRFMKRFDVNGDGVVTSNEIQQRQKKMFARFDQNKDGKLEMAEMPKPRAGQGKGQGGQGGPGMGQGGVPGLDQGPDDGQGYDQN